MGKIILEDQIIDDPWRHVHDGDTALPDQPFTVSLARWREQRGALHAHPGARGVRIGPGDTLSDLAGDLRRLTLICVTFAEATDGRAYSLARLLRTRFGYGGELRATGEVLRDQLDFMRRCGFNAFELRADQNLQSCLAAFGEVTPYPVQSIKQASGIGKGEG